MRALFLFKKLIFSNDMKNSVSLIVSADVNGCIGKSGPEPLVWKQKADMMRFKKLTTGNVVIMGFNTFVSLGRPLPNRINIVDSKRHKDELLARNDVIVVESLEEAITLAITAFPDKKPFLIGGGMLYNEAIEKDFVKEFFLTVVKTSIQGDAIVKFHKFSDSSKWEYCNEESVLADDSNEFKSIFFDVRRK